MAQNMSETLAPVTEAEAGVRQWMGDKEFNSPFWKMFPDEVRAGAGAVGTILPEIGESLLGLRTARSILGAGDIASAYKPGRRKEAGAVGGTRAKTYNPDVGTKARQMRDDGASRREIWDETFKMGQPTWFDPKDGRLQFEINDSGSRYIPYDERFKTLEDARVKSVEAQAKLKDINRGLKEQPDLFKQELTEAKYGMVQEATQGEVAAERAINPFKAKLGDIWESDEVMKAYPDIADYPAQLDNNLSGYGSFNPRNKSIAYQSDQDIPELERTLAHEAGGHAIGQIEGQSSGGSPAEFSQTFSGGRTWDDVVSEANQKFPDSLDDAADWMNEQKKELSAFDQYELQGDEMKARAIEKRLEMPWDERGDKPFYESYDRPEEDSLYRYRSPKNAEFMSVKKPLGSHPNASPGRVVNKTKANQGYTVDPDTGDIPESGFMMGQYANEDPRNMVLGGAPTRKNVSDFYELNDKALRGDNAHMGTWWDGDNTYLDVSKRFENERAATKFGERTGQLNGWDLNKQEETPVGNWMDFINSDEYKGRLSEMSQKGKDYLSQHPTDEWWDIHGTALEDVYGKENLPQVAGFIASTAPNANPTQNMRTMSEYMRRYVKGEDTIQPDWRVPDTAVNRTPGVRIGMEAGRVANLNKSARGDYDQLRADKVNAEGRALMGDDDAMVFDRWHARGAEKPIAGVYTDSKDGFFPGATKTVNPYLGTKNPYESLEDVFRKEAGLLGETPRNFSADVWTGIREEVKNTGKLFGEDFDPAAVYGESKAYADVFTDLIKEKAKHLGISISEMKKRLKAGDTELLSTIGVPASMLEPWMNEED